MLNDSFHPHEANWTPNRVRRFWAYLSNSPQAGRAYFSSHSGDAIIAYAERYVPLHAGRVLDYGCGPGFLIENLLRRGIRAEGLEFSPESIDRVRKRCGDHPLFGGIRLAGAASTSIKSDSIEVVFLVEVLEHLPAGPLAETLADIRRILRPGGFLIATTPHREDLDLLKTICPDCGCVFHPWQHLNSFTATDLSKLVRVHGIDPVVCRPTTFGDRRRGKVLRFLRQTFCAPKQTLGEPHLILIGRKRA